MPVSTIQANVRAPLAAALSGVGASVYETIPEAVIPPVCMILADSPYFESTLIGSTVRVKINFIITAAVAYNNNAGALNNLEILLMQILGAVPSGYVVGDVQTPQIVNVGTASLLSADLSVSTYYTQTN
jgi:hypothetical protein